MTPTDFHLLPPRELTPQPYSQTRLSNAGKLLGGLGGEEARWKMTVEALGETLRNVPGDVMVSARAYNSGL